MISGRVTPDGREAVIALTLFHDSGDETRRLEAVIDTGFTDRLTLPPEIVEELRLPLRGSVEVVLADGVSRRSRFTALGCSGTVGSVRYAYMLLRVIPSSACRSSPEVCSVSKP